jgi:hypothetical protein
MSDISSAISSLNTSVSSMGDELVSTAESGDITNPETMLEMEYEEYEYESGVETESSLIYDLKEMCTEIASNIKG